MTVIDLRGPQGNAFYLIGTARKWCKQLDKDPKPIVDDMTSGDYDHLVKVFRREFKHLVEVIGD